MSDIRDTKSAAQDEWHEILVRRADSITSVRNDIYGAKWWQLMLNFVLAGMAIAGLIVGMVMDKTTVGTAFTVIGVVFVAIFIGYIYLTRTVAPMSFQQYTCTDGSKTYRYQVFSKTRSAFSDGVNHIEAERGKGTRLGELIGAKFRYDFFADMKEIARTEANGKETFSGKFVHGGVAYKCSITFSGDTPLYGDIDGSRIKYFDVNNPKQKFIVPTELRTVVTNMGVKFPKVPGLHVRDDKVNRG